MTEGGKEFLRDAWSPLGWRVIDTNFSRVTKGQGFITWCGIRYFTSARCGISNQFFVILKWTFFELEGYHSLKVKRPINREGWHLSLVFFVRFLTSYRLMSFDLRGTSYGTIGPKHFDTIGILWASAIFLFILSTDQFWQCIRPYPHPAIVRRLWEKSSRSAETMSMRRGVRGSNEFIRIVRNFDL